MLEFIEQHRNFIFTILPDFLRNKWTMMVLNIIIFVFFILILQDLYEILLRRAPSGADRSRHGIL